MVHRYWNTRCLRQLSILLSTFIALLHYPYWSQAAESVCFGTPSNGRLENGVKLPTRGKNFVAYIFSPTYHSRLFASNHGGFLKTNLRFMKQEAWVRHDEHYHVDFLLECKK